MLPDPDLEIRSEQHLSTVLFFFGRNRAKVLPDRDLYLGGSEKSNTLGKVRGGGAAKKGPGQYLNTGVDPPTTEQAP